MDITSFPVQFFSLWLGHIITNFSSFVSLHFPYNANKVQIVRAAGSRFSLAIFGLSMYTLNQTFAVIGADVGLKRYSGFRFRPGPELEGCQN